MAPKTKPKPQSQPATKVAVEDLFSSIQRNSDDGKYDNVVKLADQGHSSFSLVHFSCISTRCTLIGVFLGDFFFDFDIFAVLSILPGDEDALQCKVVALIKGDHFDRALSVIKASKKSSADFGFYKVLQSDFFSDS